MSDTKELFYHIQNQLSQSEFIAPGKMMSSEGITYKTKVFAFYYKDAMVFKLGKGYDPSTIGIEEWEWLNPFKKKPPLKGWFIIKDAYQDRWTELAGIALEQIKKELD